MIGWHNIDIELSRQFKFRKANKKGKLNAGHKNYRNLKQIQKEQRPDALIGHVFSSIYVLFAFKFKGSNTITI